MSHRHPGPRSPTQAELDLAVPADPRKTVADLKAKLGEAEAWLKKLRSALRAESNGHALALAAGYRKEARRGKDE